MATKIDTFKDTHKPGNAGVWTLREPTHDPQARDLFDPEGYMIARGYWGANPRLTEVVRAVNAHDGLVAALDAILRLPYTLCEPTRTIEIPREMYDNARAALAVARGEGA